MIFSIFRLRSSGMLVRIALIISVHHSDVPFGQHPPRNAGERRTDFLNFELL